MDTLLVQVIDSILTFILT